MDIQYAYSNGHNNLVPTVGLTKACPNYFMEKYTNNEDIKTLHGIFMQLQPPPADQDQHKQR